MNILSKFRMYRKHDDAWSMFSNTELKRVSSADVCLKYVNNQGDVRSCNVWLQLQLVWNVRNILTSPVAAIYSIESSVLCFFIISCGLQQKGGAQFFCLPCRKDAQPFLGYVLPTKLSFHILFLHFSIMCTLVTGRSMMKKGRL